MKSAFFGGSNSSKTNCICCILHFLSNQPMILLQTQSQLTQDTELFLLAGIEISDAAWMLQACICLAAHCDKSETSSNEKMGYKCDDRVTELFAMTACFMSLEIKV